MAHSNFLDDPAHWRMRGEEMRTLAEGTTNPKAKKHMLKMAKEYEEWKAACGGKGSKPPVPI
jgi:hypothetical protein